MADKLRYLSEELAARIYKSKKSSEVASQISPKASPNHSKLQSLSSMSNASPSPGNGNTKTKTKQKVQKKKKRESHKGSSNKNKSNYSKSPEDSLKSASNSKEPSPKGKLYERLTPEDYRKILRIEECPKEKINFPDTSIEKSVQTEGDVIMDTLSIKDEKYLSFIESMLDGFLRFRKLSQPL